MRQTQRPVSGRLREPGAGGAGPAQVNQASCGVAVWPCPSLAEIPYKRLPSR